MEYNFSEIEKRWQQYWAEKKTFRALNPDDPDFGKKNFKGKYYVLDMFPYPSGAGLHVGHPLGYIASDIVARYKRHCGYNVLHPMGYDSFGLPAEQYAIQTGQHPAITTEQNIKRYREQLDKIGFSFDWDREVKTSDPDYYKWTQWIFLKLFNSWYNPETDKAEPIEKLIERFRNQESRFTIDGVEKKWEELNEKEQSDVLMEYRLAYLSEAWVNWCPALGTVLANDEVKDGVSERGGHPVERKRMPQWSLRITAYAERLLRGLDTLDWSESIKEAQRNWIGRSEGSSLRFHLSPGPSPQERGGVSVREEHGNNLDLKPFDQRDFYTTNGQYWNLLIDKAKAMRSNPTPAEAALWNLLTAKTTGFKFRRQHIINCFIVDFVCLEKMLVIEVDGDIHDLKQEQDIERSQILNELGFDVIRFRNEEVIHQPDNVIEIIVTELKKQKSYPDSDDQIQIIKDGHEEYSVTAGGLAIPSPEGRAGEGFCIEVFTTRPDTVYGVTFLTLAPENDLVLQITTDEYKKKVEEYIHYAKNRSERERQADVKKITGQFTGAYAIHPFTHEKIPVWVGEYVLAGYGTGAVMGVPAHDTRDYAFAKHFNLPIKKVIQPNDPALANEECFDTYDGKCINSDLINGLDVKEAIKKIIAEIEKRGLGKGKVNYRLRDAIFGRQRYWGEPIPIYYHLSPNPTPQERGEMIPCAVNEKDLPIVLPEVDKYLPTETGEPPLARAKNWFYVPGKGICSPSPEERGQGGEVEHTTMPGWAGSSWYFLRYMDADNENEFASKKATDYWQQVDLYIGGSEHATGHLLYFRFWTKFLKDLGYISIDEPAQKLINQGMIQGVSEKIFMPKNIRSEFDSASNPNKRLNYFKTGIDNIDSKLNVPVEIDFLELASMEDPSDLENLRQVMLISAELINESNRDKVVQVNMDSRLFENSKLELKRFFESEKLLNKNNPEANHIYILVNEKGCVIRRLKDESPLPEDFELKSVPEVEKMSKSKRNVITPDTDPETGQPGIIEQYGADCLRMYEMFLGPLEQHKPWNTNGITGVFNFLKKMWRLYHLTPGPSPQGEGSTQALKVLHRTIKKITEDIENYSFNTAVSAFMICVNELTDLKCTSKEVLEKLCILISPFAPHLAEELWQNKLGNKESVAYAGWPEYEEKYLVEDSYEYPVSINGKTRFKIPLSLQLSKEEVEKAVLSTDEIKKYIQGSPKKVIVVPGRIVNVVV